MSRWLKKVGGVLAILAMAFLPMMTVGEAKALTPDEFTFHVMVNNVENCYKQALVSDILSTDYHGFDSLMNNGYKRDGSTRNIKVPVLVTKKQADGLSLLDFDSFVADFSCYELFNGNYDGTKGLFEWYGHDVPLDNPESGYLKEFMSDLLQYERTPIDEVTSGDKWCYEVTLNTGLTSGGDVNLGEMCIAAEDYPLDSRESLPVFKGGDKDSGYYAMAEMKDNGGIAVFIMSDDGAKGFRMDDSRSLSGNGPQEEEMKFDTWIGDWGDPQAMPYESATVRVTKRSGEISSEENVGTDAEYTKDNNKWKDFIKALTGHDYDEFEFTDRKKYDVYKEYLRHYSADSSSGNISMKSNSCQATKPSTLVNVEKDIYYVYMVGKGWCLASLDKNKVGDRHTMGVFTADERRVSNKVIYTLPELINLMGELDYGDTAGWSDIDQDAQEEENSILPDSGQNSGDQNSSNKCAESGGGGSLGWIICPILNGLGEAAENIYQKFLEPRLQINANLFGVGNNSGNGGGTWAAWEIFRNMANIVFIILFLVVIFSQLTGVGIDNYGIKKILPKLIVVAILVNLSYYICVFFVDLSNIVGNGLRDLFVGIGEKYITIDSSFLQNSGLDANSNGAGWTILSVLLLTGAAAGAAYMVFTNPAMLLALLVAGLGIVIAIFFLFMLLAAREAAIVVFVVISPLAFVCYMLPNTKKLFDKWLNISKGLLLVYPVAGLLMGGGNFASRLLLSSGMGAEGFVAAFSAMIVGVAPIFFIPTVLRGAFSAMGNLGARISGIGDRVRKGTTGRIRNSEGYKNMQKVGAERRMRYRAGIDKNGNLTRRGERMAERSRHGLRRLLGADKRRASYVAQARKNLKETEAASATLTNALSRTGIANAGELDDGGEVLFEAHTEGAYYGQQFLDAARNGDIADMNAIIEAMRASGMKQKDIAKLVRHAQNQGYLNSIDGNTRATWWRDLAKKYGNDFMATDFELNHFAATGGTGNGGVLGNFGDYANSNAFGIDDIKPEDILKLSGDSMAGMISSGKLDQGMAQRIMAMNPNMSADKRIMLGALASGSVGKGVDANKFKDDAKRLASNRNAGGISTITANGSDSLASMVSRWTAPTAQRTTVVQEFFGDDDRQLKPVEVVFGRGSGDSGGPDSGGSNGGPSNPGGGSGGGGAGGGAPKPQAPFVGGPDSGGSNGGPSNPGGGSDGGGDGGGSGGGGSDGGGAGGGAPKPRPPRDRFRFRRQDIRGGGDDSGEFELRPEDGKPRREWEERPQRPYTPKPDTTPKTPGGNRPRGGNRR